MNFKRFDFFRIGLLFIGLCLFIAFNYQLEKVNYLFFLVVFILSILGINILFKQYYKSQLVSFQLIPGEVIGKIYSSKHLRGLVYTEGQLYLTNKRIYFETYRKNNGFEIMNHTILNKKESKDFLSRHPILKVKWSVDAKNILGGATERFVLMDELQIPDKTSVDTAQRLIDE